VYYPPIDCDMYSRECPDLAAPFPTNIDDLSVLVDQGGADGDGHD